MNDETKDIKRLDLICGQLMEHYDTVQIFVSKHEGELTCTLNRGRGHWYARYGQIQQWIERCNEQERDQTRKESIKCSGIIIWPFHILCFRRSNKTGLCKRHRVALEAAKKGKR